MFSQLLGCRLLLFEEFGHSLFGHEKGIFLGLNPGGRPDERRAQGVGFLVQPLAGRFLFRLAGPGGFKFEFEAFEFQLVSRRFVLSANACAFDRECEGSDRAEEDRPRYQRSGKRSIGAGLGHVSSLNCGF